MISIFSAQKLTSRPYLAIDTIRFEIFRRLDPNKFIYWTDVEDDSLIQGCIKKIPFKFKNKYLRFLERIYWMRKINPDFIIVIGAPLDFLFYLLKPPKSKVLVHLNIPLPPLFSGYPYYFHPINRFSIIFSIKMASGVIVVSEYVKRTIEHLISNEKIFVIPNGVDINFFNPEKKDREYLSKKYKIDSVKPWIIFVGELIKRKRPDIIVKLAQHNRDKIFIVVGRKNKQLNFEQLIQNSNNIKWVAMMERGDIVRLLASSDVFILPSLYEGFGMVIIEAMASGCPVIGTDCGAISELITDGVDGFKVKKNANEIEMFSQLINSLLENHELKKKIITHAIKKVKENFNWERLCLQWENALKTIFSNANG